MIYYFMVAYLAIVCLCYWLTGTLVWWVSPVFSYMKFISYKSIKVQKFKFYMNLLSRNHKLFVFQLSSITIGLNIDELSKGSAKKKAKISSEEKQRSRTTFLESLKYQFLRLFLDHFLGFTLHLFNITFEITNNSNNEKLFLFIRQLKINFDIAKTIVKEIADTKKQNNLNALIGKSKIKACSKKSEGANRITWTIEHYLLITNLVLRTSNSSSEAHIMKNFIVNLSFLLGRNDLGVSEISFNVSNHKLDFPVLTIFKLVSKFYPQSPSRRMSANSEKCRSHENEENKSASIKEYQENREKQLNEFLEKLRSGLINIGSFISSIKEINLNLSDISIDELYLFFFFLSKKNYRHIFQLIENRDDLDFITQICFQVKLSKFNISLNKLSRYSPGYELLFSANDEPVQYISSLMNLRFNMVNRTPIPERSKAKRTKCDTEYKVLEVFQIPNINFTIQTNSIFQTLKILQRNKKLTSAVARVSSHLSSPTVEFNSFYFGVLLRNFKQLKYYFKELLDPASAPSPSSSLSSSLSSLGPLKSNSGIFDNEILNYFYSSISRFLPLIFLKVTIEDTTLLVNYFDSETGILRTVSISLNFIGFKANTKKKPFNHNRQIIQTSIYNKIDVSGIKVTYQQKKTIEDFNDKGNGEMSDSIHLTDSDEDDKGYTEGFSKINEEIIVAEYFNLKFSLEDLPNLCLVSGCSIDTLFVDLSSLAILKGLSAIVEDIHSTSHYYYLNEEKLQEFLPVDSALKQKFESSHKKKDLKRALKKTKELYKSYLFQTLPQWIKDVKIFGSDLTIILGSRSLLIPKDLLKEGLLSENEMILNSLRKAVFRLDSWSATLDTLEKSGGNDLTSFTAATSTTATASSIMGGRSLADIQSDIDLDNDESDDDRSSSKGGPEEHYWDINLELRDIRADIIACDPRIFKKNIMRSKKTKDGKHYQPIPKKKHHLTSISFLRIPLIGGKFSSIFANRDQHKLRSRLSSLAFPSSSSSSSTTSPMPFLSPKRSTSSFPQSSGFTSKNEIEDSPEYFKLLIDIPDIDCNYSAFAHFIILSSIFLIKNTILSYSQNMEKKRKQSQHLRHSSVQSLNEQNKPKIRDLLLVETNIKSVDAVLYFPLDFKMKLQLLELNINLPVGSKQIEFSSEITRMCVQSPTIKNYWERLLIANNANFTLNLANLKIFEKEKHKDNFVNGICVGQLDFLSARLSFPFNFIIHQIFDNIGIMKKVFKQLNYSFKENSSKIILQPKFIERPTVIPKFKIKGQKFLVNMDDDPFESQLAAIYQTGLSEQRERLSKLEYFSEGLRTRLIDNERFYIEQTSNFNLEVSDHENTFYYNNRRLWKRTKKQTYVINSGLDENEEKECKPAPQPSQSQIPELVDAYSKLEVLQRNFAKSWINRMKVRRKRFSQELRNNPEYLWKLLKAERFPKRFNNRVWDGLLLGPPLMSGIIEDLDITVSSIDFPLSKLPQYLHNIGKGMPFDMKYQMLVPLHVDLRFNELRGHLRDYPLPLVYMPPSDDPLTKSVRISGNVVVLEEFFDKEENMLNIFVPLVPSCVEEDKDPYYSVVIPKTLASVKTFLNLKVSVNSSKATRFTWGASYQPAIQQIMLNFDGFTKPQLDPSDKVGFWDKLRSSMHGRIKCDWNQTGSLDIAFKGSRDPYKILYHDAGYILSFSQNATLDINKNDNPKEFCVVNAGQIRWIAPTHVFQPLLVWSRASKNAVFIPAIQTLNISNLSGFYLAYDSNLSTVPHNAIEVAANSYYEKTVINLSGHVIFKFGVLFERKLDERQRTDKFIPHYKIRLTNPDYVHDPDYDAYQGFRSHFIHMALSLISLDSEDRKRPSYNSVHLSSTAFDVFFKWWKTFSGAMSLPIRHGKIFGPAKPTKKFSVFLSTIKYQFLLSPLYACHVYRDKVSNTLQEAFLSGNYDTYAYLSSFDSIGLKGKFRNIRIDLHQRKQPTIIHKEILNTTKKIMKMKFNVGEIDIEDVDIRIIKAIFDEEKTKKSDKTTLRIFDDDISWYDINDFEELFVPSIKSLNPVINISPLMYTPRMMYFRKMNEEKTDKDPDAPEVPFGNEPSHDCVLSEEHSSIDAQIILTRKRIEELQQQIRHFLNDQKHKNLEGKTKNLEDLKVRLEEVRKSYDVLRAIKKNEDDEETSAAIRKTVMLQNTEFEVKFNNRFIIHNMLLKWNCDNRDLLFKYGHLLAVHKAVNHFITNDALATVYEVLNNKLNENDVESLLSFNLKNSNANIGNRSGKENDTNSTKTNEKFCTKSLKTFDQDLRFVGSNNLLHNDDYLIKLVSPQIQLINEDTNDACMLVVAPSIEMKVISIKQKRNKPGKDDSLNELLEYSDVIETRVGAFLHEANIFAFYKENVIEYSSLYFSANSYGSNSYWPPWLGVELCTNGTILKDNMMLEKTSMMLRYDRVGNTLKAEQNDADQDKRRNKIFFNVPKVIVSCDSRQYSTLYSLIWDLLIYSEPALKEISSKLEKLVMKTSLSNVSDLLMKVKQIQKEIKILDGIERTYVIRAQFLTEDDQGKLLLVSAEKEDLIKQLYTSMKAIALGGENNKNIDEQVEWSIRADSIICHMLVGKREPFIDIALSNSRFERRETSDGSNENMLQIEMMQGFTLSGNTYYQEMFSPFEHVLLTKQLTSEIEEKPENLITVKWSMKRPIGGIKVMKYFRIFLQPIKLQLDQETGKQIFDYVFSNEKLRPDLPEKEAKEKKQQQHKGKESKTKEKRQKQQSDGEPDQEVGESAEINFDSFSLSDEDDGISESESEAEMKRPEETKNTGLKVNNRLNTGMSHLNASNQSFLNPFQNYNVRRKASKESVNLEGESMRSHANNVDVDNAGTDGDDDDKFGVDLMLQRASHNFNIESFKLDACILCISYKGEGKLKLVSVNNFLLKVPNIIISRQVLSIFEITMFLKKVVLKSLLQHSGKLLGNKLKHHNLKKIKQPLYQLTQYNKFVSVKELQSQKEKVIEVAGDDAEEKIENT